MNKSNRANRAAQFNAFDALKGLQEALREKEEKMARVEKRELSEDAQGELSDKLSKLEKGNAVEVTFYSCGKYAEIKGETTEISTIGKYIGVGGTKIFFDDIAELKIISR